MTKEKDRFMPIALRHKTFTENDPIVVTICCITYNHQAFITDCIEGFLDQECDFRVEVVIHDDASNDGTTKIIKDYAARHPTVIRAILQNENQYSKGVNPYYAYVFPAALGNYIAICDGDDYWSDPAKLARQVAVLDDEQETIITYGPVRAITESGESDAYCGGAKRNLSQAELKGAHPINTLTTCFRNIYRDAPPPAFLRNSPIGDLTVWGMLGYHGSGRYLADMPPANYRIHEGGVLSLMAPNKQLMMTALAHLNLAAYHNEQSDIDATKQSLIRVMDYINETGIVRFYDVNIDDMSFRNTLRLWNRRRKLRRSARKARELKS